MYYKIKISNIPNVKGITTYLTEDDSLFNVAQKISNIIYKEQYDSFIKIPEIEEIKLMKNFKPAINEKYDNSNKLYIVKIAEDMNIDGKQKTIKYELPVFANNSDELHQIVNEYISQGLENMRLTTISETKWIWI